MDRKNLLFAGSLISIIAVLVIGIFIIIPAIDDFIIGSDSEENTLLFDNSTPKATATSIARLYPGVNAFYNEGLVTNASLTSDGKYWIVRINKWNNSITIDPKTWMSKTNIEYYPEFIPPNTWLSLDELKANSIAEIRCGENDLCGRPQKIAMDGKEIWKVPVYFYDGDASLDTDTPEGYIYVDLATGKSKVERGYFDPLFNLFTGTDGWLTLKQVKSINNWNKFLNE